MSSTQQEMSFLGIRVRYGLYPPKKAHTGAGQRILLLCSPLLRPAHWGRLISELNGIGFWVVAAELPGFGTKNMPLDRDLQADILWGLLDDIDLRSGAPMSMWHLAGHGSACATVLQMAVRQPNSVQSQSYICPLFVVDLPQMNVTTLQRIYDETVLSPDAFANLVNYYAARPLSPDTLEPMRRGLKSLTAREDFLRLVRRLSRPPRKGLDFCPALVLRGLHDPLMTQSAVRELERLLPEAETHKLGSGHFPMVTHSVALWDIYRGWVRYISQE